MLKKFFFLISFILTSCSASTLNENKSVNLSKPENIDMQQNTSVLKKSFDNLQAGIPNEYWTETYFKTINQTTREADIESLQKSVLSDDDFEVRIWFGFGTTKLEGFVLSHIKNEWSATHIDSEFTSRKFANRNIKLNEPKSGWNNAWQKLLGADILTLPDAESLNCNAGAKDGMSYVVEIKKGEIYRTYMYENPWIDSKTRCQEADQMLEIGSIIAEEFGLPEFKLKKFLVSW